VTEVTPHPVNCPSCHGVLGLAYNSRTGAVVEYQAGDLLICDRCLGLLYVETSGDLTVVNEEFVRRKNPSAFEKLAAARETARRIHRARTAGRN